jgi:hypothetical protein
MFDDEFLPLEYEAPKTQGNYVRLQEGDTKVRILSRPILGWEDWDDRTPMRYRLDQKPEKAKDAKRPVKHFWAMIVWNYNEERIQIWHITQASIIRALEQLVKDPDWGKPYGYDIKINKTGQEMRTKYAINPVPHKPINEAIKSAFEAKRCKLEALYDNGDPFGEWRDYTEGCFGTEAPKATGAISPAQLKELMDWIGPDDEYHKKLTDNCQKHFGIKGLSELPIDKFEAVLKSVKLHAKERAKKEMDAHNEELPF